jgi:nitroreductase
MHIDVDQVDEVLSTARSVRKNLDFDRPVERKVLLDCINVAVQAPTGLGGENWRFVVVDDAQPKKAIAVLYREVLEELLTQRGMEMKPTQQMLVNRLHEIPAMMFVCVDGVPMDETPAAQIAFYGSILPAAWSLMLALRARNLGATWTSLLSARQEDVAKILGMPAGTISTVMFPVGYLKGATLRRAKREAAERVTFWNQWGGS